MKVCVMCGRPAECEHHLIFGRARRRLSDLDDLTIDLCNEHHNLAIKAIDRIHGNSTAEKLSKMLVQALWERNFLLGGLKLGGDLEAEESARSAFIGRYGRSYL